jgi:hypothetical protein
LHNTTKGIYLIRRRLAGVCRGLGLRLLTLSLWLDDRPADLILVDTDRLEEAREILRRELWKGPPPICK